MIIDILTIWPDGTQVVVQEEVPEDYFDIEPLPEPRRDVGEVAFIALAEAEMIADTVIAEYPDPFPVWDEDWTGPAGSIVHDEGALYRSTLDVTVGMNTKPSETPSAWTLITGA